ncbi:MAG: oligopeptide transporter, OPT family [Candidatus Omnitrophota bacterium]
MAQTNTDGAPAVKTRKEFSFVAIFLGVVLSVIMGAANVYLGLRAGMTVSASIPAAVIAMGFLHGVLGRKSVLESNLVQTGASAGESLAAGIIFTMPAMILAGLWKSFDFWTTTFIALGGGLLGVLFMIPMRRVFIVENKELKFPEGVACAEVLRAGESEEEGGDSGAKLVFASAALGAFFKFCASYLGLMRSTAEWAVYASSRVIYFGMDISPALAGVGLIVGLSISLQIFLGGALGWLIAIPLMKADPASGSALDAAWDLWDRQVRYIGVGAMLVGGVLSIWQVRSGLVSAAREMLASHRPAKKRYPSAFSSSSEPLAIPPEEQNLSGASIVIFSLICIVLMAGVYFVSLNEHFGITALITVIMVLMAFFFTAVASYLVGLVGNSNSPVSGMAITALLATGAMIHVFGYSGTEGMIAALGVAGVVCCVACTSGDVCNDLKTGHLVGASPRYQQIMQILGVIAAAFIMAPIMTVLHEGSINDGTGGIGGRVLAAPQAALFASLVNGFFGDGQLPWNMVYWGLGIGALIIVIDKILYLFQCEFRLHVMAVAVGIYLPFGLSTPILLGGLLNAMMKGAIKDKISGMQKRGVLAASGIIAGESLTGVLLGFLTYMEYKSQNWGEFLGGGGMDILSVMGMFAILFWMHRQSSRVQ